MGPYGIYLKWHSTAIFHVFAMKYCWAILYAIFTISFYQNLEMFFTETIQMIQTFENDSIITQSCWWHRASCFFLSSYPYHPLLLTASLELHLVDVLCWGTSLLVGQYWCVCEKESIECHLWVCPYFASNVQHLFVLLGLWDGKKSNRILVLIIHTWLESESCS